MGIFNTMVDCSRFVTGKGERLFLCKLRLCENAGVLYQLNGLQNSCKMHCFFWAEELVRSGCCEYGFCCRLVLGFSGTDVVSVSLSTVCSIVLGRAVMDGGNGAVVGTMVVLD